MPTPDFFADGSPFLHHPLLTLERTANEVDFLVTHLNLGAQARVLDVGCGFGRHCIELARRGIAAVGVDPSPAMIAAARERAAAAEVDVQFVCADGETFAVDGEFDAAICLFTTLGQMGEAGDNLALMDNVFSFLRNGGGFVVETPQRDAAVRALKTAERFGGDDAYTEIERVFDARDSVVTERFRVVSPQAERTFILRYRLFSADELAGILTDAGFQTIARFADYSRSALDDDSPTMIMIGCKP